MLGKRKDIPAEQIEKQITARIARHLSNPAFVELGKRLNALREKYADIQQSSLNFLRELLELAQDTVAAKTAGQSTYLGPMTAARRSFVT
jgi:type I restriction enzyme, R subunit